MTGTRMRNDELLALAKDLAARLLGKHGEAGILAVGVHGPAARGEDASGLDLAVVTTGSEVEAPERLLRHRGVVVDLGVITAEGYLAEAAVIGPAWPLATDQYRTMVPVYDPSGFFAKLRAAHEEAMAGAPEGAFLAAAGWNLAQALAQQARAERAEAEGDPARAGRLPRRGTCPRLRLGGADAARVRRDLPARRRPGIRRAPRGRRAGRGARRPDRAGAPRRAPVRGRGAGRLPVDGALSRATIQGESR
jgi:hypothetical protein